MLARRSRTLRPSKIRSILALNWIFETLFAGRSARDGRHRSPKRKALALSRPPLRLALWRRRGGVGLVSAGSIEFGFGSSSVAIREASDGSIRLSRAFGEKHRSDGRNVFFRKTWPAELS